jgi:hypothetical protein
MRPPRSFMLNRASGRVARHDHAVLLSNRMIHPPQGVPPGTIMLYATGTMARRNNPTRPVWKPNADKRRYASY